MLTHIHKHMCMHTQHTHSDTQMHARTHAHIHTHICTYNIHAQKCTRTHEHTQGLTSYKLYNDLNDDHQKTYNIIVTSRDLIHMRTYHTLLLHPYDS